MPTTDDLICAALRGENPAWPGTSDPARISTFLDRVAAHGAQALLHECVAKSHWPPDLLRALRESAIALAIWELGHQLVLARTLTALKDIGVQPVLIKGSALAYSLYSNPALRTRGDTDLVIPIETKERVHEVLTALGFDRCVGISGEFVSYQASYMRSDLNGATHTLDVHWKINNSELLSRLFTYEELRRVAQPLTQLCPHALGASPVHALLIACMHRATHRQNAYYVNGEAHHDANRLIWLYDIHLLAGRLDDGDWHDFVRLASGKGLRAVCLDGMQHAQACFGTSWPVQVLTKLAQAGSDEAPARYLNSSKRHQQWMDFCALGTSPRRLRFVRELVFPPSDYMRSRFAAPSAWLLWLYLRRAAGGLERAVVAQKRSGAKKRLSQNLVQPPDGKPAPRGATGLIRAFLGLNRNERQICAAAFLIAPFFALGLRALGLSHMALIVGRSSLPRLWHVDIAEISRMARLVNAAGARSPCPMNCLSRSLLLQWLLRRRGIPAELRIGVRLVAEALEAHAWVEWDGLPIGESADVGKLFAPFEGVLPTRSFSA